MADLCRETNKYRLDHQIVLLTMAIESAEDILGRMEAHLENMRGARVVCQELRAALEDEAEIEDLAGGPVTPSLLWQKA